MQALIPGFTTEHIFGKFGPIVDTFLRAFLGALLTLTTGVLHAPDLHAARALGVAAILGAFAAGVRAIKGFFTKGDWPAIATGT